MSDMEWIDLGNGRKLLRKVGSMCRGPRSDLAAPMLVRAFSEPVQSMANGKWYENPRDLENTYKAGGNPQGEEYIALGNDTMKFPDYTPDPIERRADIKQAVADVLSGNVAPEIAAIE